MEGKTALDTIKSFKEILSSSDYDDFIKGEDSAKLRAFPEVQEFLKGEDTKEGEEETTEETTEDTKEGEEEEKEKALIPELIKGLETRLDSLASFLAKSHLENERLETIEKSIESLSETIQKIADQPSGRRAIKNGSLDFFEKALGGETMADESGKKILSTSLHKEEITKSLESGLEKAQTPELKSLYENSIVRYNGGGGSIDQEVAMDLFHNHDIRLVK